MSVLKDYVFLFERDSGSLGMAFCKGGEYTQEQAREQVRLVLDKHGIAADFAQLNYLGMLDYTQMDEGINKQLHHFIKHDPVWLLFM